MPVRPPQRADAEATMQFIAESPSPYHAVAKAAAMLDDAGFTLVRPADPFPAAPGGGYTIEGGGIVAWYVPAGAPAHAPFRIIGAHTDSPNLRLKPTPEVTTVGYRQLGVEVYGGALLNSWLDRDLGLSGRAAVRCGTGFEMRLVRVDRPVLRVPQLAIHLDREVNERGVVLDRQQHLVPVWGLTGGRERRVADLVAETLGVDGDDVLSFDLMAHDLTPPAFLGDDEELIAAARLDNLASCWAALTALVRSSPADEGPVRVVALFDHEEVGSQTASGAGSPLLEAVLQRCVHARGGTLDDWRRAVADSWCVSADMAHAVHPNYLDRYEPRHLVQLNKGPVLKVNASQRYATDAAGAAFFRQACEAAEVPHQTYAHRSNLACGSTIGPITATRLGIPTVDVGNPMLSMHSARELAGADDPTWMVAALTSCLTGPASA